MQRSIILRDYAESDLGVYRYITDAMGIEPKVEIVNYDDPAEFEKKIRSLDGPGDLLLGLVYQRQCEIPREWLPSVDRFGLYIHRDNQWRTDQLTIQPISENGAGEIIHAPYGVRPWFVRSVEGIREENEPDLDVVWLGTESYKMLHENASTRSEWLDRFEELIDGRFKLHRQSKIYSIQEYATIMCRAKIALHIHGLAEHCFRFWESLHLGRCLVSQRFTREKLWEDPGDIFPWFDTPQKAADVCSSLLASGDWKRVRKHQKTWYDQRHSQARLEEWGLGVASKLFP